MHADAAVEAVGTFMGVPASQLACAGLERGDSNQAANPLAPTE